MVSWSIVRQPPLQEKLACTLVELFAVSLKCCGHPSELRCMEITAEEHVSQRAAEFVDGVPSAALDYSEESLGRVTAVLAGMSEMFSGGQFPQALVEDASCYLLEVARREFGGVFKYHAPTEQLVLVTGLPNYEVSITAKAKVVGLLSGDLADDLAFHYSGFAERARSAKPGDVVMFV